MLLDVIQMRLFGCVYAPSAILHTRLLSGEKLVATLTSKAAMKIPLTDREIKWHTPGTPAHHSPSRTPGAQTLTIKIASGFLDSLPVKIRSTSEAAVSQRIRGKFMYLSRKAAALSAADAPPGRQLLQAAAGDTSWALKNEKYANEALRDVRLALYSRKYGSFKSSNKFATDRWGSEVDRLKKGYVSPWDESPLVNVRHGWALRSIHTWESTMINCKGLAIGVMDLVANRHPLVPVSLGVLPGHVFSVIGAIAPENVNLPLRAWPSHVYVCDPWANIACPAPEYPAKFAKKMEKWDENGKQIRNSRGEWISPSESGWASCVERVPTLYTRRQFADGQFESVKVVPTSNSLTDQ